MAGSIITKETVFGIILSHAATISSTEIMQVLKEAGYTNEELKKEFRFSDADIAVSFAQSA